MLQISVRIQKEFVLILLFQVPVRPNYNLVLYYVVDRPVNKDSLLDEFVNGSDIFRDSRFKLKFLHCSLILFFIFLGVGV